jgi:hypothetical protein
MRKLSLVSTAAIFIATQAALAAPLPTATGPQIKGMDDAPIISAPVCTAKASAECHRAGPQRSRKRWGFCGVLRMHLGIPCHPIVVLAPSHAARVFRGIAVASLARTA